jgi:hypothetical protein
MGLDAGDYSFKLSDFEHPSPLFVLEDRLRVKSSC